MPISSVFVAVALAHLGLLFMTAGGGKLRTPRAFARQLELQGVLPFAARVVVARLLAPTEVVVGLWTFSGVAPLASASVCAAALAAFFVYRIVLAARGSTAPCGCSGEVSEQHPVSVADAIGVGVNLAVAVAVAVTATGEYAVSASVSVAMAVAAMAIAVTAAVRQVSARRRLQQARAVAAES